MPSYQFHERNEDRITFTVHNDNGRSECVVYALVGGETEEACMKRVTLHCNTEWEKIVPTAKPITETNAIVLKDVSKVEVKKEIVKEPISVKSVFAKIL